ncbi:MAG: hypothetical protein K2N88_02620 [Muribaculaceae bacterium]|nr:hypothetical protein [Muribaculaceae bacterium]
MKEDSIWLEWLKRVMELRPKDSPYLDSPRGIEVTKLCLAFEKQDFNWHRSDEDAFWIDVQMYVKYKLSDEDILFIMKQQPGVVNYSKHAAERNAYAEMMRGIKKLRQINFQREINL